MILLQMSDHRRPRPRLHLTIRTKELLALLGMRDFDVSPDVLLVVEGLVAMGTGEALLLLEADFAFHRLFDRRDDAFEFHLFAPMVAI